MLQPNAVLKMESFQLLFSPYVAAAWLLRNPNCFSEIQSLKRKAFPPLNTQNIRLESQDLPRIFPRGAWVVSASGVISFMPTKAKSAIFAFRHRKAFKSS